MKYIQVAGFDKAESSTSAHCLIIICSTVPYEKLEFSF